METRAFPLKIKSVDDAGRFVGLASTYGEPPDLGGDVIERGAFTQAIKSQGPGYPLLLSHKQDQVLGIVKVEDSDVGLVAHGELDMTDPAVQSTFSKIKMRALRGLSIGFLPAPGKVLYNDEGGRVLKEVRLFEISLTPVPMNTGAQIFSVKSVSDARLLLQKLKSEDVEQATLEELHAIDTELKRLMSVCDPQERAQAELLGELTKLARDIAQPYRM